MGAVLNNDFVLNKERLEWLRPTTMLLFEVHQQRKVRV